MTPERAQHLIQGYAFGTLSRDELQELSAAALDDEDLFLRMAEADDQRHILAVPGVRAEALRIVQQAEAEAKPSWRQSLAMLFRPAAAVPALALAALVIAFVVTRDDDPGRYSPTNTDGQLYQREARIVAELQAGGPGPEMAISPEPWMNGSVAEADSLSFRVRLTEAASVFVVQQMPDGRARFVFPESLTEPAQLEPGEHRIALEASPPGSGISGTVPLIVAAFAAGAEVRLPGSNLEAARQRMTRQVISYVVRAP